MTDPSINLNHSITLVRENCSGCTKCLRVCPTEAIRIRNGYAQINDSICIDCAQCLHACTHNALAAAYDKPEDVFRFPYRVALPSPVLYGQFDCVDHIDRILQALLDFGFDDVYEVACAMETVSSYTGQYIKRQDIEKPVISSACPAVVRFIQQQFPDLLEHVNPILPPIELAAKTARQQAMERHPELREEDIGVCYVSPCPAMVSYLKGNACTPVDCVISMNELCFAMVGKLKGAEKPSVHIKSSFVGVNWSCSGGEAGALGLPNYLAADGMDNVAHILEKISNGSFPKLEYVELNACHGGCIGGELTVENSFIAKARIKATSNYLPRKPLSVSSGELTDSCLRQEPLEALRNANWPTNMAEAFRNRARMQKILETLPGIDCGACGSPSCLAYAKDIVMGRVGEDECVVHQRLKWKEQSGG